MSARPTIFHYHALTHEYLGSSLAEPDPLDANRWVLPDSATLIAPGEPSEGFISVFEGDDWDHKQDCRGQTWWTEAGVPVVIEFLGDPAASGLLSVAPEEPPFDPASFPLSRLTFWLAAAEIGVTKAGIRAHIDAMPEGVAKFQALAYLEEAQVYRRQDPLLIQMAAAEGITETELDALWAWAAQAYP